MVVDLKCYINKFTVGRFMLGFNPDTLINNVMSSFMVISGSFCTNFIFKFLLFLMFGVIEFLSILSIQMGF